jgi:V8-like Glu-specific endopeptidase
LRRRAGGGKLPGTLQWEAASMADDSKGSFDASGTVPGSPKEITATTKHPYRSICVLVCRWPEGSRVATGFLFGEHVVVTVGHALFDRKTGAMPLEVTVSPGASRLKRPFPPVAAGPDRFRIFPGYQGKNNNEATAQDLGAILLREPVGQVTGWRDLAPADLKPGEKIVLTGYPQSSLDESTGSIRLIQDVGKVLERERSLILHDAVGSEGQSGGPLWRLSDKSPWVMSCGMHTGNHRTRKGASFGLLFDWRHYNWIQARMREAEGLAFAELDQFVASGANRQFGPRQAGEKAESDFTSIEAKSARKPAASKVRKPAEPAPSAPAEPGGETRFTVRPKGKEGIDLELTTGQILQGVVRVALAAGTFTDCDLVLEDEDEIAVDHLPMFVSSSDAEDFHSERFKLTAQADGPHRLVLKELNGVSAAIVRIKIKPG